MRLSAKMFAAALLGGLLSSPLTRVMADPVVSLRGDRAIEDSSRRPARAPVILPDDGKHSRSFDGQPPMIPHKVDTVRISLSMNQCLGCHGDLEYKDLNAPKVSDTHFVNRNGETLGHVSTRYYFCTQCHASQVDKTPLVVNTFAD